MKPKKSFFQSVFTGDKDKIDVGNKEKVYDDKIKNIANFENDNNDLSKEAIDIVKEIINENVENGETPIVETDIKIYEVDKDDKLEKEAEVVKVDFVYQELTDDLINQLLDGDDEQVIPSNNDNQKDKNNDENGIDMPLI